MTQLSTFGGVVVPSPAEAAVVPADLLNIVNQFCGSAGVSAKTYHTVSSRAERDANYDGYQGLIVCLPLKTIWWGLGRTNNVQQWSTVFRDTGWVTVGFVMATNWTPYATGTVKARRTGQTNYLRVQATYSGVDTIHADDNSDSQPGNIVDMPVVAQMPSDFLPADEWTANFRSTFTGGSALLQPAGVVKLIDMHTDSKIIPTQSIQTQFVWPADD